MALPHHPTDHPPKGWTAESALGLGLAIVAVVMAAFVALLVIA
jgi:hypothetical protein